MKEVGLKAILGAFLKRLAPVRDWREFDIAWQRAG